MTVPPWHLQSNAKRHIELIQCLTQYCSVTIFIVAFEGPTAPPGGEFQQSAGYSAWLYQEQLHGHLLNTYLLHPRCCTRLFPATRCSHHPQNGEFGGSDIRVNNSYQGPKGLRDTASGVSQTHSGQCVTPASSRTQMRGTLPVCQVPL